MAAYTLTWKHRAGPMPGACETCDFMSMEDEGECIVGYIGDVTARVLCLSCVSGANLAREIGHRDETVLAFDAPSGPIEGTFRPKKRKQLATA